MKKAKTITNRDYEDHLAQTKSLLLSLEQTARGIGLFMNSDKTDGWLVVLFYGVSTLLTLN